jgi:hypothetical protein
MKQLSTKTFTLLGCIIFLIIGIANALSLSITYQYMNIFSRISGAFGVFFNLLIAYLFATMYSSAKNEEGSIETIAASDDIEKIIKEIKKRK